MCSRKLWKGGTGIMGRGRPKACVIKVPADKKISQQDRKDLRTLADDFGILYRQDAQEVIKTCRSYAEGQRKIMRIYTAVYMK